MYRDPLAGPIVTIGGVVGDAVIIDVAAVVPVDNIVTFIFTVVAVVVVVVVVVNVD